MKKFTIVKNSSDEIYAIIISEKTTSDKLQNILNNAFLEAMKAPFNRYLFEIFKEKIPSDCTLINVDEENVITF